MTVPTPDNLSFPFAFLVHTRTLGFPSLTKDVFRKSAGAPDIRRVTFIEHIHDLIRNDESFVLQDRVARESIDYFTKSREVPKETPG